MLTLRVGGVAEHYNLPWHLLIESEKLSAIGVELQWIDCPGGTGEMTSYLNANELDMAVLLTEGMVTSFMKGSQAKIASIFVKSSLEWGVHSSRSNPFVPGETKPVTIAISRKGSGSHLMALLYLRRKGIALENVRFKEVGSLAGALQAFDRLEVDLFLWEKYTTEPYCSSHDLALIDSIFTPWPCFVIAVREAFYKQHREKVSRLLSEVFREADLLKQDTNAVDLISERYHLSRNRVNKWFEKVVWGDGENLSVQEVNEVIDQLRDAGNFEVDKKRSEPHEMLLEKQLIF